MLLFVPKSKLTRLPATRMPIARMKAIYEAIKTERRPNCSVLAKKLEVSAKTIERDIDYMRYHLDLPIEFDQERNGFFFTEAVAHFPSVHITESELVALLVARKAIEQYANTPFQKPLAAAFHKLSAGLGWSGEFQLAGIGAHIRFPADWYSATESRYI